MDELSEGESIDRIEVVLPKWDKGRAKHVRRTLQRFIECSSISGRVSVYEDQKNGAIVLKANDLSGGRSLAGAQEQLKRSARSVGIEEGNIVVHRYTGANIKLTMIRVLLQIARAL